MTPLEATTAIARPIGSIGSRFMFDPATYEQAATYGYAGLDFYVCGRGGVLGDVDASVVQAAFGFFDASSVRALWEQGRAVAGATAAAERFSEACAAWGRAHFSPEVPAGELRELATAAAAAVSSAGLPLFAGWRAMPLAADDAGAACQALNVLRELRGGAHLVAVVAAGVAPLHAVLATGGEANADLLGHTAPYPDVDGIADAMIEIERSTDRIVATGLEALGAADRARLAELVIATRAGLV